MRSKSHFGHDVKHVAGILALVFLPELLSGVLVRFARVEGVVHDNAQLTARGLGDGAVQLGDLLVVLVVAGDGGARSGTRGAGLHARSLRGCRGGGREVQGRSLLGQAQREAFPESAARSGDQRHPAPQVLDEVRLGVTTSS